ncbi:MAG: hypothetical protein FJ315_09480 [SAR202 cluster bacterium]|nr:hypothetical protein [SAR202 cluster bacterium]
MDWTGVRASILDGAGGEEAGRLQAAVLAGAWRSPVSAPALPGEQVDPTLTQLAAGSAAGLA